MNKKNLIKMATASTMAATAFVAAAPIHSEASSSIDRTVDKAANQMIKAFNTYNKTARVEGKLPSLGKIKQEVKLAQDLYKGAVKEIDRKGGTKKQKASYRNQLDDNKKYLNRAELYLKAVTTNLNPTRNAFTSAVDTGKQSTVLNTQIAFNKKISEFEKNVAKVYGPDARRLLLSKYATPANKLAASVNAEMKVYQAYKRIEKENLIDHNLELAGQLIDSVKREVTSLRGKNTILAKNIIKAADKNNNKYENALVNDTVPFTIEEVNVLDETTIEMILKAPNELKNFTNVKIQGEVSHDVGNISLSDDGVKVSISGISPALEDGREYVVTINGKTIDHSGFKYTAEDDEAAVQKAYQALQKAISNAEKSIKDSQKIADDKVAAAQVTLDEKLIDKSASSTDKQNASKALEKAKRIRTNVQADMNKLYEIMDIYPMENTVAELEAYAKKAEDLAEDAANEVKKLE